MRVWVWYYFVLHVLCIEWVVSISIPTQKISSKIAPSGLLKILVFQDSIQRVRGGLLSLPQKCITERGVLSFVDSEEWVESFLQAFFTVWNFSLPCSLRNKKPRSFSTETVWKVVLSSEELLSLELGALYHFEVLSLAFMVSLFVNAPLISSPQE